jgi:MFS family permease
VLAAVLGAITIPAHAFGLRRPWFAHDTSADEDSRYPREVARSRPFVILVVSLSLGWFAVYAVVVTIVPLLTERGLSASTAAWALGLGGVGQVLGRLGYAKLVAHTSVRVRTTAVLCTAAATTVLLGLLPGPAVLLIGAAVRAGTARGVFTLLHATAVSDRWGSAHYGRLGGLLAAPLAITAALAPWVATGLAEQFGGYPDSVPRFGGRRSPRRAARTRIGASRRTLNGVAIAPIVIDSIPLPVNRPVFLAVVAVHVLTGGLCVLADANCSVRPQTARPHPVAGRVYYVSLVVIFLSRLSDDVPQALGVSDRIEDAKRSLARELSEVQSAAATLDLDPAKVPGWRLSMTEVVKSVANMVHGECNGDPARYGRSLLWRPQSGHAHGTPSARTRQIGPDQVLRDADGTALARATTTLADIGNAVAAVVLFLNER